MRYCIYCALNVTPLYNLILGRCVGIPQGLICRRTCTNEAERMEFEGIQLENRNNSKSSCNCTYIFTSPTAIKCIQKHDRYLSAQWALVAVWSIFLDLMEYANQMRAHWALSEQSCFWMHLLAAFSRKSSFSAVVKFFNIIGLAKKIGSFWAFW